MQNKPIAIPSTLPHLFRRISNSGTTWPQRCVRRKARRMQQSAKGEPVTADSDEGLKLLLSYIHNHHQGWNCDVARTLLKVAEHKLKPIARQAGLHPAEALTAAWELWRENDLDTVQSPWAYTAAAVRRASRREDEAQRKLTSVQGLRRQGSADITILTLPVDPSCQDDQSSQATRSLTHPAVISARQCLIMAGLTPRNADRVIAELTDQLPATCDRLSRNQTLADNAGLNHTQWRALIVLLLGTTRGRPGLMELVTRGHPNPIAHSYIRRASSRLLAVAA